MNPTLASLKAELTTIKRELAAMTKKRDEALAVRDASIRFYDETAERLKAIKEAALPIVAYMDTQWPGTVGPELRRLKELCR